MKLSSLEIILETLGDYNQTMVDVERNADDEVPKKQTVRVKKCRLVLQSWVQKQDNEADLVASHVSLIAFILS